MKEFKEQHVQAYNRVEVINKPGAPYPIVYFLDKHNAVIRSAYKFNGRETAQWFLDWLEENNLGKDKEEPNFIPPQFPRSEHCIAFRAFTTSGLRTWQVYPFDVSCVTPVATAHPGVCECIDGSEVKVDFTVGRVPFTCEEKCKRAGRNEPGSHEQEGPVTVDEDEDEGEFDPVD